MSDWFLAKVWKRIKKGVLGPAWDIKEWTEKFPGRCLICAYHDYGLREGHTSEPAPKPHHCIESKTEVQP